MKRLVRPWKPLTCCIAALCHLASPILVIAQQGSAVNTLEGTENAPPVIEDPLLETDGTTKKIEPKIPVGKTLLIPIAASDADGDPLSYKVTSSTSKVMVRVRTGRPHLKFDVSYAGTTDQAGADPQFSGTLDFQLFRDWTPVTAGFIGGFAQSLFYSPRQNGTTEQHTIFHRVVKDFMCQGGDPNGQLPDPSSGSPLERGPGFTFENEFDIPLLFSGRGQLAMANAGLTNTYKGTNGSQFFITTSSPRFLDVKHSIFGQLARGWELLEKMNNVPVQAQPSGGEVSRPKTDIKITNTSVVPNFSDALLVLSAIDTTPENKPATITVQVSDGKGGTAEKQFQVSAVQDEFNTPPIFTKLPEDQAIPIGKISSIPVKGVDLEQDYFIYENSLLPSYFPRGQSSRGGNPMLVLPDSGNPGPMTLGFWMRQLEMRENSFEFTESEYQQQGQRDRRSISLGAGDANLRTEPVPVLGKPNVLMTNVQVASYVDTDPRGVSSSVTVSINWGDGTPASAGGIGRDTSRPAATSFQIVGTHTYVRKGVYPVVTTISSSKGLKQVVRSAAVITDGDVRLIGQQHEIKARTFSGKPLATITDAASGTTAADYESTVDWGDGVVTPGQVKQTGAGQLYVTGTHPYQDPETFSVAIRVHKKGTAAESDAYGWATLDMKGFQPAEQHLPPFPMAHLVGLLNPVLQDAKNPNTSQDDVYKPIRSTTGAGPTSQTTFTTSLSLLNTGNKKANPSKIRFYLSYDQHLNLEAESYTDNSVTPPVQRTNPKDIPLTIGKKQKEISLIALSAGQGGSISFDKVKGQDSRLFAPPGENGSGLYLLAAFVYDDPLAKQLPIDQEVALDVAPVFTANPSVVELTETTGTKHSQQFVIQFDRRPTAEVKIPLTIVDSSGYPETSEAYFNNALPVPPQDKPNLPPDQNLGSSPSYTVSLTPAQWDAGTKTITVAITGKQDFTKDSDQTVYVQMGPATSDDPRYHRRSGPAVRVVNRDLESLIQVTPVALQTTEAEGSGHSKTFTVQLMLKPTKDVIVPIVNGDETEGQVTGILTVVDGKPSLTFTPTEQYPATRTITVTSVDDNQADGNAEYTISVGPTVSEDTRFTALNPPDVTVTNTDNPPAAPSEIPADNSADTTTVDPSNP